MGMLLNTFGRGLVQTASIPFVFKWTKCFSTSWIAYQKSIRNSGYQKYQPKNDQILIEYAKIGFRNSELGKEILNALRMAIFLKRKTGTSSKILLTNILMQELKKR